MPLFEPRMSNGQGLDALALWNLLQTFNRERMGSKAALRGRLEVSTAPQAHQLADKSKAMGDCKTCHRQGSEAFQTVTISVVGPDGRRVRVGANPDVLSSVISIDAVRGFYAIGGTRIMLLDILLVLAFLGGLAVPIGTSPCAGCSSAISEPAAAGPGGPAAGGDAQGSMRRRHRVIRTGRAGRPIEGNRHATRLHSPASVRSGTGPMRSASC